MALFSLRTRHLLRGLAFQLIDVTSLAIVVWIAASWNRLILGKNVCHARVKPLSVPINVTSHDVFAGQVYLRFPVVTFLFNLVLMACAKIVVESTLKLRGQLME